MKHSIVPWALLAAMIASACGDDGVPRQDVVVRDSAGIQIIEHDSTALDKEWRSIAINPGLQIGVVDGEEPYMFHGAMFGLRHEDGRIVVHDWGALELRYFDPSGRHVKTTAGRGGGPGEIQTLGYAVIPDTDSSIAVVDVAQIVRYDWAGTYIGRTPIDYGRIVEVVPPDFHASLPVFPTSSGHWFEWSENNAWTDLTPTRRERHRAFFLFSPDFDSIDTLGIGAGELSVHIDRRWPWVPFSVGAQGATGGRPSRIYITNNRSFDIHQFDASGKLDRIIRIAARAEPVLTADIDYWISSKRASGERRGDPASAEVEIREMPIPSTLPPFRELAVDRLGRLWAERYVHVGEARRYLVVDTTGMVLGNVVMPERFSFMDIGEDYILGTWRNEMDVEFVRLYRY